MNAIIGSPANCEVCNDVIQFLLEKIMILKFTNIVHANAYCSTIRKHRHVISNKRCGLLSRGVMLFHENSSGYNCSNIRISVENLITTGL